jgi:glycosyltransferase involved in cell wall biosynthesis
VAEGGVRAIAFVLGTSTGGIGRHVRSLVEGLAERGVRTEVFCPHMTAEIHDFTGAGASVTPLDVGGGARDAAAMTGLRRALRSDAVDIVHAHGLSAGLVATLARPAGLPLVVTWHTTLAARGMRSLLERGVGRTVAAAADVTLCASNELVEAATQCGARDVRPALIAAPAHPAARRTPPQVREEFGLAAQTPLIISIGRLEPHKRHDVLISAAARWRRLDPPPTVLIAGIGPSYRSLAAQAAVARAPVILVGQRDDIADLMLAADLAVGTSDGEARQMFAQEALASGVPLITTDVPGMAALVGDAALLVPPGDVDAVDAAVRGLLERPAERARLAAAGLARAATWPTEAETVNQVVGIYAELNERAAAPSDS